MIVTMKKRVLDYPLEYVRWTLNRNMQTYVDLIDRKNKFIKSY